MTISFDELDLEGAVDLTGAAKNICPGRTPGQNAVLDDNSLLEMLYGVMDGSGARDLRPYNCFAISSAFILSDNLRNLSGCHA